MSVTVRHALPLAALAAAALPSPAMAEQLYDGDKWANIASDDRARDVSDVITVLIFESASATNRVTNRSSKETAIAGGLEIGSIDEEGNFHLRGGYSGSGQVDRTDRLMATMAGQVIEILPNGDLLIEGRQVIHVNGETRTIDIRGQIRQTDISSNNTIPSWRLANAQINYDGKGFVSRSAKPGIINQIFSFLGLA